MRPECPLTQSVNSLVAEFYRFVEQEGEFDTESHQRPSNGSAFQIHGYQSDGKAQEPALHFGEHSFSIADLKSGRVDLQSGSPAFNKSANMIYQTLFGLYKLGYV